MKAARSLKGDILTKRSATMLDMHEGGSEPGRKRRSRLRYE